MLRGQKAVEVLLDAAPARARGGARRRGSRSSATGRSAPRWARAPPRSGSTSASPSSPSPGRPSPHLRALDVYVLPSAWEAFPIGVLEALACGVPQVATDVGGTREAVVPETGILVPPRDPGALALALTRILQNRGAAARWRPPRGSGTRPHFGLEPMLDATAALYSRVLAQVPRVGGR